MAYPLTSQLQQALSPGHTLKNIAVPALPTSSTPRNAFKLSHLERQASKPWQHHPLPSHGMDGQALVEHLLDGCVGFGSMGGAVVQYALALTAGEMALNR